MILVKKGKKQKLDELAQQHLKNVLPTLTVAIADRLAKKRLIAGERRFYTFISENNYSILKEIITSKPHRLEELIDEIDGKAFGKYSKNGRGGAASTKLGRSILKVFYYTVWRSLPKTINWIAEEFNTPVCSYCNRQYTSTIEIEGIGNLKQHKLLFQTDHFYPKVYFPYLALSFYNLVPSCAGCNSGFKSIKKFSIKTYIHPYVDSFHDVYKFTLMGASADDYFFNKDLNFKIKLVPRNPDTILLAEKTLNLKAKNTLDAFQYEAIYKNHKDYVFEIIQKHLMYNNDYIESMYNQYSSKLFSKKEELMVLLLGNYIQEEDLGKRPLAKLTRDIADELGLLKSTITKSNYTNLLV